jgi:hypothetical protein
VKEEKREEKKDNLIWGICSCSVDGYPSFGFLKRRGRVRGKREKGSDRWALYQVEAS